MTPNRWRFASTVEHPALPNHELAKPSSARQVALLISAATAHGRGVLRGIARYVAVAGNWSCVGAFSRQRLSVLAARLGMATASSPAWKPGPRRGFLARAKWPTIDVRGHFPLKVPVIDTDDAAVARLAFEHFRERGFRQLGFAGFRSRRLFRSPLASFPGVGGRPRTTVSCIRGSDPGLERTQL